MNEPRLPADDKLDALLQSWSHHHAASPETLERLQRTITASLVPAPIVNRRSNASQAIVAVCAVAAAMMIAIFAGITTAPRRSPTSMAARSANAAQAKLTSLWTETSRLFGTDLEWICDLDGELLLGVKSEPISPSPVDRVYLAITVRIFDPVRGEWVDSWNSRIACRGGTTVDFASADHRSDGSIWVQSRPDGQFAVSHWLNWRDHPELSGPINTTVSADKPQVVAEKTADGRRIQIVQQVWRPNVG